MIISISKISLDGIPKYRMEDGYLKKFIDIVKYEKIIKYKMVKPYYSQNITIKLYGNFPSYPMPVNLIIKGQRPTLWVATGSCARVYTNTYLEYLLIKKQIIKNIEESYEKYIKIQV